MLRQSKAATFYGNAKDIDKIEKADLILLYHNNNRVIAVGSVVTPYQGHDFKDMDKIEHWVDVNWLWKATFDENYKPLNSINRNDLEITMVNGAVVNITDQLNYNKLFEQISLRQTF